jgi:hypothetical protein
MAHRRKRLAESDIATILKSLKTLPITVDRPDADRVRQLPVLSLKYQLTVYDAAYPENGASPEAADCNEGHRHETGNDLLRHRDGQALTY